MAMKVVTLLALVAITGLAAGPIAGPAANDSARLAANVAALLSANNTTAVAANPTTGLSANDTTGLAANLTGFEAAEKRATECCAKLLGPSPIVCSLGVINANMRLGYETYKATGLIGPNGVSAQQRVKVAESVKANLPLLRRLGVTNSTGCITKWLDHSDCCRTANVPNACLHLCDYSHMQQNYDNGDVEAIVRRNLDFFGQCQTHLETLNKCSFAA